MADQRMTFLLEGRDRLSRVLDRAGDAAARMARRVEDAFRDSSASMDDMGSSVSRNSRQAQMSMRDLKVALATLAPAAVPVAAAMVPIAAAAGAASVAMLAFTAAVIPQVMEMGKAADAQEAYTKAVRQHGPASAQAAKAEAEMLASIAKMPRATREAAAALGVFKDTFRAWSDSLASSTMPAFTASLEATTALLPRLSGVVKGASGQMQRLMSVAAGGFASPGFDRLMDRFTTFTNGVLRNATNSLVHFMRVSASGQSTWLTEFMDYAHRVGPQVGQTLSNIGRAVGNLLRASADAGVGILQLVNAFARLVAAVPPGLISVLLQTAVAIKAVRLAAAGLAAVTTGAAAANLAAFVRSARFGGVGPAVSGVTQQMSRMQKVAAGVGVAGVALVVGYSLVKSQFKATERSASAMGSALKKLQDTGQVTGEMARAFGKNLRGLSSDLELSELNDAQAGWSGFTKVMNDGQFSASKLREAFKGIFTGIQGSDQARKDIAAFDAALAGLVQSGHASEANRQLDATIAKMKAAGQPTAGLTGKLKEYKSAVADAKFEQQLAAQSMGLFGDQAMKVQAKLDGQKRSADGLRQSIQALNDVNRQGLGGMIGFEAAIDAATAAARENAGALKMSDGALNLNSEGARKAATALQDLASRTDEAAATARQSNASWETVNGIYARGRAELLRTAMTMGLTRAQAKQLADQILKTPDKTAKLKGDIADLKAKIEEGKRKLANVPDSRKAKVRADIADLQRKLDAARRALASLRDKTVTVTTFFREIRKSGGSNQAAKNAYETSRRARGGPVPGYASGGHVQALTAGGYIQGPGSSTSDSIMGLFSGGVARVSDREYVIQAAAVRKYGTALFDRLNGMRVPTAPVPARAAGGAESRQGGPLIGSLTVNAGPNASADDVIGAAMYQARVARRGGVHSEP